MKFIRMLIVLLFLLFVSFSASVALVDGDDVHHVYESVTLTPPSSLCVLNFV
jgi:hypothetical protein